MVAEKIPGRQFPEWVGGRKRLDELRGKEVEIRARFMRHEHRDENDLNAVLSPEGQQAADRAGETYAVRKDGTFFRTSPVERVVDTASRVRGGIEKRQPSKVHEIRVRQELGPVVTGKFAELWQRNTSEYIKHNYPNLKQLDFEARKKAYQEADDEMVDWWFEQGDKPADPNIPSVRSIAAKVAVLASRIINTSEKSWDKSKFDQLLTSHKPVLEAFLKEVLIRSVKNESTGEMKTVHGLHSIKEVGGSLLPGEGWELLIRTDAESKKSVRLHFRGVDYEINLLKLEELRQEGIQTNRERRAEETLVDRMQPDRDS